MARETLLHEIHPLSVFRIPAELSPSQAAAVYDPVVHAAPLDLVLLGIGPDGHTASLFPGCPALTATTYVTGVRAAPKPPAERVTLTLRGLREATRVIILVAGADKAGAVHRAKSAPSPQK
jgi:6-phosphogluconolactonase